MQFQVYRLRREGRLLPRHSMWTTKVVGHLCVDEIRDKELSRHVRFARLDLTPGVPLLGVPTLHNATLVSARPGWWTMTGWERVEEGSDPLPRTFQQSWVLIPLDEVFTSAAGKSNPI
jgi:hypothetical protein